MGPQIFEMFFLIKIGVNADGVHVIFKSPQCLNLRR